MTPRSSLAEIVQKIQSLREEKGKEKETLKLIAEARRFGHDFVLNLFWEEALTFQHQYMNRPKKEFLNMMEKTVSEAKFYIEKYDLKNWYSRLYRFLGRISDYKGSFTDSVRLYKKSISYISSDPEPFRLLELKAFLCFAIIMTGKVKEGVEESIQLFEKFDSSQEGKKLKKDDYHTWAIWRSGIPIKTVAALLEKKQLFNKKDMLMWLEEAKADLKKGSFDYRKNEIKKLEAKLRD